MARRALGPATLAVVQAVERLLRPADGSLLVACSGGPDSLALAAATAQLARKRRLPVAAMVVDHGLQAGSDEVAARAVEEVRRLGITETVLAPVTVDLGSGAGPEAAAREARYAALEREAVGRGATVLLGHTLDDQAETVLLGLARGSGTRSLAGMAVRTGRCLRPMLGLRRSVSEQVCGEVGARPWSDPHNADPAYARVRVRTEVLPLLEAQLGPGVAESLSRTARLARDDADFLDALALQAHPDTETLECARLETLPAALRGRVVRRWLGARGSADVGLVHALAVDELVARWHGQAGVDVPGGRVTRAAGRLVFGPPSRVAG